MAVSLGNSGDSQGLAEVWTKGDSRRENSLTYVHTPPPVPPGRTLTLVGLRCPFLPRSAASRALPQKGPVTTAPRQARLGPISELPDLWPPHPPPPPASRPGEGHTKAPTERGPGAPPRARSRARRPCRLGFRAPVPVSDPRPSPAAASPGAPCTRGCRCRPGVAVSARALLLSDPPPVPTAGRSEPGSRERSAEFCCGAGGAGGGAEL
ncbi:basic proline-rich protein-like [Herpailurus yagouaroundi]|uniref:basic proline-rich protein-like n=1 Tax=Herpailurus yagouaroundi TaxID=1608482 RepID=UPI001AD6BB97|nr:basic proline-rich protein-like [Puma yagouaroundi]